VAAVDVTGYVGEQGPELVTVGRAPMRLDPARHPCQLHKAHRPEPLVTVRHHVQPLGMGGPDVPWNWLDVCDTGHRNVHTILGPMCQDGPRFGKVGRRGTRTERDAAKRGFSAWVAAGKPGNPHAAFG
jgi:hypothetical protein